jgi:hypothetical protein
MRLATPNITASLTSAVFFCAATYGGPALAWGGAGHTLISRAGAMSLPTFLPNFLRTPEAVDEIAALGPEPDRSKDAGRSHDADRDTGHYADIDDDGTISGVALNALPATREAYDTALRAAGTDQYKMGYLPYSLIDGWQQVAKDFAIWRVDRVGEEKSTDAADRAWFAKDRELREILTLRDIGVWSHFVGDASQPLHVSVHYNGWGNYPNPNGFTESKETHANFEGAFVREHATLAAVLAHMRAPAVSSDPIATQVGTYLKASASQVVPLYTIEKQGGFASGSPAAIDFVDARLADGAAELRDLIVAAWNESATVKVGYPDAVTPAEAEGGTLFHRNQVAPSD